MTQRFHKLNSYLYFQLQGIELRDRGIHLVHFFFFRGFRGFEVRGFEDLRLTVSNL